MTDEPLSANPDKPSFSDQFLSLFCQQEFGISLPSLLIGLTILFDYYKQVARQRVLPCLKSVNIELIAFTRALRQGYKGFLVGGALIHRVCDLVVRA